MTTLMEKYRSFETLIPGQIDLIIYLILNIFQTIVIETIPPPLYNVPMNKEKLFAKIIR